MGQASARFVAQSATIAASRSCRRNEAPLSGPDCLGACPAGTGSVSVRASQGRDQDQPGSDVCSALQVSARRRRAAAGCLCSGVSLEGIKKAVGSILYGQRGMYCAGKLGWLAHSLATCAVLALHRHTALPALACRLYGAGGRGRHSAAQALGRGFR